MAEAPFNHAAAALLRQCADLLRQQNANPFRANAYLRAAQTLETLPTDVRTILEEHGRDGLTELPFIGTGIAQAIVEIAKTGRLTRLDRLRGEAEPEALLTTVPGIGPTLARVIHEQLHVDTLEALEIAAHDGRLAHLPGIGARRLAAIRAGLAALLGRARAPQTGVSAGVPPVAMLLGVDAAYLQGAAAGSLPMIAPRRFNPRHEAWLPILHTTRDGWHFTAVYSNTARAHELGRTRDWVVIYFYDDQHREGQHTVVSETRGPLEHRRVVRGREAECAAYYGLPAYGPAARSA